MALRGNLKDFSLPDVFQLVTFSRKTGVLRIKRADSAEGSVWFRDGDVFFASSNWHAEPLGERLVKAERITPQALSKALDVRASEGEGGRRLGRILIDEGYITEGVLEDFVSDQIQDTIFDLMRWDEGDFDFEAMPEVAEEDIGLSVSIENVVMEGSRRLEEWNRIRKKIPSTDVVFKMATAPGEGTFEISLKPTEWELLLLVDGTRDVAELAYETGRTDFEVARIIYGLFSAGLLEFATDDEIAVNRAERAEREAKLAEIEKAQAAKVAAAAKEAQDREAKLAAQAEARREAETPATPAAAAVPVRTEPAEEPSFLGGSTVAPTADDQAVLEQFMGAVLEQPAAAAPPAPAPKPVAEPYVPAEEPAFMGVTHTDESELELVPVPSVEDLLGIQSTIEMPAVGLPEMPPPPSVAEIEAIEQSLEAVLPEPEIVVPELLEPPLAEEAAPAAGFEQELMALGLGELPSDLLEPVTSTPEPQPFSVAEPIEDIEPIAEPMSSFDQSGGYEFAWQDGALAPEAVDTTAPLEDLQPVAEPMTEAPPVIEQPAIEEIEPFAVTGLPELDALELGLELPAEVPLEVPAEVEVAQEVPDFSELMQSLELEADTEPEPAADFDEELLRDDDEVVVQTGGVISTDAFLDDITIDDLGFSGGLSDELSALTGADAPTRRPQASVNAIPDAGSEVLHRDTRVDKETLKKIIEGIEKL